MARYKLKLSKLDFCSLVDDPAQPNAKTLLIKRKGKREEVTAQARLAKVNDELGLAFFWAFTSTNADGTDHYDLQGDAIDADFIKAAMDFMVEGAGAVDEMHDFNATDGRVVFAMPMNPEIASAYGITTKQSGLMIAIKPTAEQLEKLKDGTYTGVSIAGWGTREPVEMRKGRVCKGSLYTDEVDGHQHQIHCYEDGTFWVSYATSAGAENSHSHAIVFEGGKLTILADSGHSHELADGQPGVVVVPADALVVVAARAPQQPIARSKSTTANAVPTVGPHTEHSKMNELDTLKQTLSDLTKRSERFERIAKMSGAHKAHFDMLADDEAEAFLAKSNVDRDAQIAKAVADDSVEVEFNGQQYRKSAGPAVIELAKAAKAQAEQIEKSEIAALAKSHLGALAGDDATHQLIVRALRKSGAAQADIDKALTAMKGWNDLGAAAQVAKGANPGEDAKSGAEPQAQLDSLIAKHATENKVSRPEATAAVLSTPEGRQLYAAANS